MRSRRDLDWWLRQPNPARWTQSSNWSPSPGLPDDIATFTSGLNTTCSPFLRLTRINTIQFDPTAPAYSFLNSSGALIINGAGIVNNSASTRRLYNNLAFIEF